MNMAVWLVATARADESCGELSEILQDIRSGDLAPADAEPAVVGSLKCGSPVKPDEVREWYEVWAAQLFASSSEFDLADARSFDRTARWLAGAGLPVDIAYRVDGLPDGYDVWVDGSLVVSDAIITVPWGVHALQACAASSCFDATIVFSEPPASSENAVQIIRFANLPPAPLPIRPPAPLPNPPPTPGAGSERPPEVIDTVRTRFWVDATLAVGLTSHDQEVARPGDWLQDGKASTILPQVRADGYLDLVPRIGLYGRGDLGFGGGNLSGSGAALVVWRPRAFWIGAGGGVVSVAYDVSDARRLIPAPVGALAAGLRPSAVPADVMGWVGANASGQEFGIRGGLSPALSGAVRLRLGVVARYSGWALSQPTDVGPRSVDIATWSVALELGLAVTGGDARRQPAPGRPSPE